MKNLKRIDEDKLRNKLDILITTEAKAAVMAVLYSLEDTTEPLDPNNPRNISCKQCDKSFPPDQGTRIRSLGYDGDKCDECNSLPEPECEYDEADYCKWCCVNNEGTRPCKHCVAEEEVKEMNEEDDKPFRLDEIREMHKALPYKEEDTDYLLNRLDITVKALEEIKDCKHDYPVYVARQALADIKRDV